MKCVAVANLTVVEIDQLAQRDPLRMGVATVESVDPAGTVSVEDVIEGGVCRSTPADAVRAT
jgi:hypothetical protein